MSVWVWAAHGPLCGGPVTRAGMRFCSKAFMNKRDFIIRHVLLLDAIVQLIEDGQRDRFVGTDCQQFPHGTDRCVGSQATAVIHPQEIMYFIGVFTTLKYKQWQFCAPRRPWQEQQGQPESTDNLHTPLLGSPSLSSLAI